MRTADKFRAAVRAGRLQDATELLTSLQLEVEAAWRMAATAEARERIANETTSLLQWARVAILTSRAHTQDRLNALRRQVVYGASRTQQSPQLNLEV